MSRTHLIAMLAKAVFEKDQVSQLSLNEQGKFFTGGYIILRYFLATICSGTIWVTSLRFKSTAALEQGLVRTPFLDISDIEISFITDSDL